MKLTTSVAFVQCVREEHFEAVLFFANPFVFHRFTQWSPEESKGILITSRAMIKQNSGIVFLSFLEKMPLLLKDYIQHYLPPEVPQQTYFSEAPPIVKRPSCLLL